MTLRSPGIEINVKDFTEYSVNLLGNRVAIPFVSSRGPLNKAVNIDSAESFVKYFGNPTTDSAFAAWSLAKVTPIVAIRTAWIYDTQTLSAGNLKSFLEEQYTSQTAPYAIALRSGAFQVAKWRPVIEPPTSTYDTDDRIAGNTVSGNLEYRGTSIAYDVSSSNNSFYYDAKDTIVADDNVKVVTLTHYPVKAGYVTITVTWTDATTEVFTDDGLGVITGASGSSGTIVYSTGVCTITNYKGTGVAPVGGTSLVSATAIYYHRVTGNLVSADAPAVVANAWTMTSKPIQKGSISFTGTLTGVGSIVFTDDGEGILTGTDGSTGVINYTTGVCSITSFASPATAITAVSANYIYTGYSAGSWVITFSNIKGSGTNIIYTITTSTGAWATSGTYTGLVDDLASLTYSYTDVSTAEAVFISDAVDSDNRPNIEAAGTLSNINSATASTDVNIVLLEGYLYDNVADDENDGNPGTFGENIGVYIEAASYTDAGLLDTVNFYVYDSGILVERFMGLEVQEDYEDSDFQIERVINNQSQYVRLYNRTDANDHIDLTALRAVTQDQTTSEPETYSSFRSSTGILDTTVVVSTINSDYRAFMGLVSSNSDKTDDYIAYCDPTYYNKYVLERETYNIDDDWATTYSISIDDWDDIFNHAAADSEAGGGGTYEVTADQALTYIVSTLTAYIFVSILADEFLTYNILYTDLGKSNSDACINLYDAAMTLADSKWFFYYANTPTTMTTPTTATAWVESNLSSDWRGATYWPTCKFYNSYTYANVEMGSSFTAVLAAIQSDALSYPWFPAAGLNRGIVGSARSITYNPTKSDRDTLYYYPNRINPIRKIPNQGIVVWGNKTLQTKPSKLSSAHVARLFIYLANVTDESTKYLNFELTTNDLFKRFKSIMTPILDEVKANLGIYDYIIVADMNAGGNNSTTIDRNEMYAAIGIKPTSDVEFIFVNFIITPTGAEFASYIK